MVVTAVTNYVILAVLSVVKFQHLCCKTVKCCV
jgi:hypothetical protein